MIAAALAAVDPQRLVTQALREPSLAGELPSPVHVLAVGKASAAMARAYLAARPVAGGLVIGPDEVEGPAPLRWIRGSHPIPDEHSVAAGREALALAWSLSGADELHVLLSGGASALMAAPAEGVTLEDKREVTRRLLEASANITELNCVRKHLSAVKGGQLAAATRARVTTLALSDVVGDDPAVIGSGPTVPDPTTFTHALEVIDRCAPRASYPARAIERFVAGARGALPETPKPGHPAFARAAYRVIGSRMNAARAAADAARARGYDTMVLDDAVIGEARETATRWVETVAARAASVTTPWCIVSTGETTVSVRGPGRGGRNQEFALAVVPVLAALARPAVVASVGTDGVDGPTDAAGAIADSTTAARASARALDAMRYLEANDSWSFFDALGDLMRTGPTGTNVGDLQIALVG